MSKLNVWLVPLIALVAAHCGSSGSSSTPTPTAPTVSSLVQGSTTIAATGTTDVAVSTALTLTFSEAMLSSTASTTNITLTCSSAQTITIAGVTSGDTSTAFTITPSSAMPNSTECTLAVGTGVTNSAGTAVTAANFVFTTVASSDTTAPTLAGLSVSGGNAQANGGLMSGTATNISTATSAITFTFSEAMDTSTITTSNVTLTCGTSQTITVSSTSSTIFVATPSAVLPQQTSCTFTIGTGVKDSAGNALASASSTNFTTGCSTNDDFSNSSTLNECWVAEGTSSATISIASNVLNMSTSTDPGVAPAIEFKSFTTGPTVTVSIPAFSGIAADTDMCGITVQKSSQTGTGAYVAVSSQGGQLIATVSSFEGGRTSTVLAASGTSSTDIAGTLFLRLAQSGTSSFTASYRVGSSGDFTTIGAVTVDVGSSERVGLAIDSDGTGTTACQFSNFTVTGASATGQD